jgi:hypothetical protein
MRESQRAYSEGYAPETNLREGSGFRAPSRQGRPTPCPRRKRAATARPARFAPYLWAFGLLVLLWTLGAAVGLWLRDVRPVDTSAYCAAVYAGQIPDWRHTYAQQCAGPKLKTSRS